MANLTKHWAKGVLAFTVMVIGYTVTVISFIDSRVASATTGKASEAVMVQVDRQNAEMIEQVRKQCLESLQSIDRRLGVIETVMIERGQRIK